MTGTEAVSASSNWFQNLFAELKRRRVFRVATLYIVAFWPLIQIVDIMSPTLELPDTVMRYLVTAFLAGFPVALILAWIFDINKDGVTVTSNADGTEAPLVGGRSELVVVALLVVLVAGLFMVQFQQDDGASSATVPVDLHSVAVLPFDTFSSNPADQQFADGLTEELLNVLAHVKALRVAARTSSFAYKGVHRDVREIGAELGVGVILEGSVRRSDIDNTIRVTAQLVDTNTGAHYFSKTYDRDFTDIFAIQDDIAGSVVDELQITLLGGEKEKIQSRTSADPEAMIAYGLGQAELAKRTKQSFLDGIRFFEKAIELDPNYIDAYVGIATTHALIVSYAHGSKDEHLPLAQTSVDRAFELDADSGNAWATQGLIHMQTDQMDKAKAALEKAIKNNPSHAMAHMWYAGLLETLDEKLTWYQKAYELDPRSPIIGFNIASILLGKGDEAGAMKLFSKIIEADPYYHSAYQLAANIAQTGGRLDEAINQLKHAYELSPGIGYIFSITGLYTDIGDTQSAREWVAKLDNEILDGPLIGLRDWLDIAILAAESNIAEATIVLQQKTRVADSATDMELEDAATAAYFLRDAELTISLFEQIEGEAGMEHFNNSNRIDATIGAAYAYNLLGQTDDRDRLLNNIEGLIEALSREEKRLHNSAWLLRSQIEAIRGNTQMAVVHLQRAIDEGFRRYWVVQNLPAFDVLRGDTAFMAMMAALDTRMNLMRGQLRMSESFDADW